MMASLLQVSSIVYLFIALILSLLDEEFCSHEIFKKQVFNFGLFHIPICIMHTGLFQYT